MTATDPIVFEPVFQERVWGGRMLEQLFAKRLPPATPIGESWEVVDREEAQSHVDGGRFAGCTLHDLWRDRREEVFGQEYARHPAARFPLLIKLLDARQKLSVQVHPPSASAEQLGGEPKTEMWHVLAADEGADIYAGLRNGVQRGEFERALGDGGVAELLHRIPTSAGDTIFIPSGRIHAIGAGNVILEIQQNSDTTYRVFDWNRVGLDGNPRELHIEQSMQSIDFEDYEPALQSARSGQLVVDPLFVVERLELPSAGLHHAPGRFAIVFCLDGALVCGAHSYQPGQFLLLPADSELSLRPESGGHAAVVRTTLPVE